MSRPNVWVLDVAVTGDEAGEVLRQVEEESQGDRVSSGFDVANRALDLQLAYQTRQAAILARRAILRQTKVAYATVYRDYACIHCNSTRVVKVHACKADVHFELCSPETRELYDVTQEMELVIEVCLDCGRIQDDMPLKACNFLPINQGG